MLSDPPNMRGIPMRSTDIALLPANTVSLAPLADRARELARHSRSPNTIRAYESDWSHFTSWCGNLGIVSLPAMPGTIALYLAAMAESYRLSTIRRRIAAICLQHQAQGFDSPTKDEMPRSVFRGITRTLGAATQQKVPLLAIDLHEMVARLPDSLIGVRDRALLLLGFGGAFRRSELVGLNVEDLNFIP